MKGEVYGKRELSPLVGQQKKGPSGGEETEKTENQE
jgi:small subunit ribosomal protein S3